MSTGKEDSKSKSNPTLAKPTLPIVPIKPEPNVAIKPEPNVPIPEPNVLDKLIHPEPIQTEFGKLDEHAEPIDIPEYDDDPDFEQLNISNIHEYFHINEQPLQERSSSSDKTVQEWIL